MYFEIIYQSCGKECTHTNCSDDGTRVDDINDVEDFSNRWR